MDLLRKAAKNALKHCFNLQPEESVLIITDDPLRKIGYCFFEEAKKTSNNTILIEITPRQRHGDEPPPALAKMMKEFQVLIIPTSRSMSHTQARREASQAGARIATLPDITTDTMKRTLNANYQKIAGRSRRVAQALENKNVVRVTSPAGTDITMSIEGRKCEPDTGLIYNPGNFSNLPAGEAYLAPLEETAEGVIVVDGSMAGIGKLKKPIKMTVKAGFVTEITGGTEAKKLKALLDSAGPLAYNVAELGIGTNDKAKLVGSVLEDEKVLGTVHMALGDNMSMGGKVSVRSHLDGIILKPTVVVDGQTIMKDGALKI
ncbi:MAG: leucyl aminopeptidase [candidate division Zixibacteria bacterium RBG_16_48_11]|nr:MAG: leucyl aminopeptidase [candidate division Zixibacteria bacterium RBG_16_48_11]